ncbi:MAG TPA: hypothetical protein VK446_16580 [Methylocystis sp.]|nr:hypothetical protein [Methylocystis sp.]
MTKRFLEVFGLASLRDLPDVERLEDDGVLRRSQLEADIDRALGLSRNDFEALKGDVESDDAEFEDTADGLLRYEPSRHPGSCR